MYLIFTQEENGIITMLVYGTDTSLKNMNLNLSGVESTKLPFNTKQEIEGNVNSLCLLFFSSYISFQFTYHLGKEFGSGDLLEILKG